MRPNPLLGPSLPLPQSACWSHLTPHLSAISRRIYDWKSRRKGLHRRTTEVRAQPPSTAFFPPASQPPWVSQRPCKDPAECKVRGTPPLPHLPSPAGTSVSNMGPSIAAPGAGADRAALKLARASTRLFWKLAEGSACSGDARQAEQRRMERGPGAGRISMEASQGSTWRCWRGRAWPRAPHQAQPQAGRTQATCA